MAGKKLGKKLTRSGASVLRSLKRSSKLLLKIIKLPAKSLPRIRKYFKRINRELMPPRIPAPEDPSWDVAALTRVLDASDASSLEAALRASPTGRVAVNGLTVTILESMGTLIAGMALVQASAITMVHQAERIDQWMDGLPGALEAILRLDITPILTLVQEILDQAPEVINSLGLLAGTLAEALDKMISSFERAATDTTLPPEISGLISQAFEEASALVGTIVQANPLNQ